MVLLLGGLGHCAPASSFFAPTGLPDGHRFVFLLFVAYVHFTAGALDLVAARALARGEASGRAIPGVIVALALRGSSSRLAS